MKHSQLFYLGLFLLLIFPQTIFSQAPEGVNYQAVVRNALGLPMNTQPVDVRFTIHQGSPTGTSVFQEVHTTTTNQFGLINLELGSINNGAFSVINWGSGGAYYLQIEVDPGSGYDDLGASQLLSVPYALFAKSAATGAQGFNSLIDTVAATIAACPTGGYEVLTGLDTNANTVLDPGEVSSSFVVCNGSNGAAILTDTSATNELQTLSISNDTIFLSNGGFVVLPSLLGDNDWVVNGTDMYTDPAITGHVGIGTNTPLKKLHIESSFNGGDGVLLDAINPNGNPGLQFSTQGTSRYVLGVDQSDANKFKIGTAGVNINTRFTIDGQGQVGVGTTTPISQLSVFSNDTIIADFVGNNPNINALTVTSLNPAAATGMIFLNGPDSGIIGLDPSNKVFWLSHSTPNGHTGIFADSAVALYGQVIGNIATSKVINQADTLYSFPTVGNNIININAGTFITDSLYKLGNNSGNANWVLANDGFGQAIWTDPTTLPGGGGLWQSNAPDIYFNTGNVGIGTLLPTAKLHIAGNTIPSASLHIENTATLKKYGVYTDAGNNFAIADISAGGFVRFMIDGTGNVGIGTVAPNANLDVTGTTETDNLRVITGSGTAGDVLTSDAAGNATWQAPSGGAGWLLNGNAGTVATDAIGTTDAQDFRIITNGTERVKVTQTGEVGIGTSAPLTQLHVADEAQTMIVAQSSHNLAADQAGTFTAVRSRGSIAAPANVLNGDRIGKLEFVGWNSGLLSFEEVGSIRVLADEDYIGGSTQSHMEFYVNPGGQTADIEAMRINGNGFIGIGTGAPTQRVQIENGSLRIENAGSGYTFPLGDGAANNVLTTDGAGNVTWQVSGAAISPWTKVGADIYQTTLTDFVGIGTTVPTEMLSIGSLGTSGTTAISQQSSHRLALTGSYSDGFTAIARDFTLHNEASTTILDQGRLAISFSGTGNELMSILSTGEVGIGTTTPIEDLSIHGSTPFIWMQDNDNAGNTAVGGLAFRDNTGGGVMSLDYQASTARLISWQVGSDIQFLNNFGTGTQTRMTVSGANGFIGVGTTTPSSTLSVGGSHSLKMDFVNVGPYSLSDQFSGVIIMNPGFVQVALPDPSTCPGRVYHVKKEDPNGTVDVIPSIGLINGMPNLLMGAPGLREGIMIISDGVSNWIILNKF